MRSEGLAVGRDAERAVASPHRSRHAAHATPSYAAIDLGTNNCRLLVAEPVGLAARTSGAGPRFRVIDAFSRIVRLGEGLAQNGVLSEPAMERTIRALAVCARKVAYHRVAGLHAVATEACRRAANCDAFIARARAETGLDLTIIDVREEAELAVAGCAELLDRATPYALIFDIGGGSTEVIWARVPRDGNAEPQIIATRSIPAGVVTLAETFGGDRIAPAVFEAMVAEVNAALVPFEAENAIRGRVEQRAVQMIGTSGTVTTLAGIRLGLRRYDRRRVDGTFLAFADARRVTDTLLALDCAGRATQPCIGVERADLVVAGCAILEAICRAWPVGTLRVADRGLREGILHRLMPAA